MLTGSADLTLKSLQMILADIEAVMSKSKFNDRTWSLLSYWTLYQSSVPSYN